MNLQQSVGHSDPIAPVIFGITLILIAALAGRFLARYFRQPSVLGELLAGVLLGNLLTLFHYDLILVLREGTAALDIARHALAGADWSRAAEMVLGIERGPAFLAVVQGDQGGEYLQVAQAVDTFSRYGVIFLLFHVGLDTHPQELRRVGRDAINVSLLGVLAPFGLGFALAWLVLPNAEHALHLFVGATLSATSIGISARVLDDLGKAGSAEAHVILGAAVIDDILGLAILAIVSGIAVTGSVELPAIIRTLLLSTLFVISVLLLGDWLVRHLIRLLRRLDVLEAKLFASFIFVMLLAWLANLIGLATIVGAFAAGLLMHDSQFRFWGDYHDHKYSIRELFAPLEAILVPVFFVLMGIQVQLERLLDPETLLLAGGLFIMAVAGKLVSGIASSGDKNRLAIGLGMLPRGEVGLVFASVGRSLEVIDSDLFSAIVLMVIGTTLVTPPLMKWAFSRSRGK